MAYVKLEVNNDWGTEYLSLPGKGLSKAGTASVKLGIKFREGQKLHVQWPSGKRRVEEVVMRTHRTRVSDMGHDYDVKYDVPGIMASLQGIETFVPLSKLEVLEEDLKQ
jgi:hypothetical protein